MGFIKRYFFATPWHLIRFFAPLTAVAPLVVYGLTVFTHVYPGTPAFLTASAASLCEPDDLANPLFMLAARAVASLSYGTLPLRLNLFCAACGALAVSFFYLFTARLVFLCACEDPGGAMAALPPRMRDTVDDTRSKQESSFALNPDGTVSIPLSVLTHNWRVAHAAVLGGLGASLTLAFCAPFWLASTRLYPFTFDLMLFFAILNLLFSYDQRERLFSLFIGAFLLAACSLESPLFLLLLPIGGVFLLRSLILNEQATTYRVLSLLLVGLAGAVVSVAILWVAADHCSNIIIPAPRPILRVFLATVTSEILKWIPSFGWSFVFMQLLVPSAIALFVFSSAFRKRTALLFLLQLALVACLVPSLLNLRFSIWGIARLTSKVPIFSYVTVALFTGLMIAVWYLMREMFQEKVDEELDFYEYRDNPIVCRIGSLFCWPLLVLVLVVPIRSFTDIDPREGTFADFLTDEMYQEMGAREWVVNPSLLQHHLMIRAHKDGRRLLFITTDTIAESYDPSTLTAYIEKDASFDPYRWRLLNAADLSPASFIREWLQHETNAYQRVVLFNAPEIWRENGFHAIPTGFFLSGLPKDRPVNVEDVLSRHKAFREFIHPYLFPPRPDSIRLFANYRIALRRQLALMANELGVLLVANNRAEDAAELYQQSEMLAPDNLSLLLNRYYLAANLNTRAERVSDLETRLRGVAQRRNTFSLTPADVSADSGTLIDPDILEYVRKNYWVKGTTFRHLVISSQTFRDPLTALRDKKRALCQAITQSIDTYAYDDAERQLNLLLDLDEKDHFALCNKALVAIEKQDLPEAGLWMDLAKENGVQPAALIWHEAAILILNNKLSDARKLLNAALPANPSDIRLWGLLADILLKLDEYNELENRVYPALRSASSKKEHYLLYMVRGYIYKHNGPKEFMAARAAFLHALQLNNKLTDVREEVLLLDDALDVPAFSEQDAMAVLRQNPEHAFANYLLGMARLHRGELDKADDLFRRSLEKDRNAPAYAGLGAVMFEKGDRVAAEKLTRRALELDESRLFARHTLAKILIATDRFDEASRTLDTVIASRPDDLDVRLTLVRLRMKQKRLDEAALLVSDLLEKEDSLPLPIAGQLTPLAAQLSAELTQ
jgi:tetratricopeptide (TPR) repeat protein